MPQVICQLSSEQQLDRAVVVIRAAFRTVAEQFDLTEQNCPSHPSFMTAAQLRAELDNGMKLYGLFQDDCLLGTVGLKQPEEDKYSLERLAVLPEYHRQGCGRKLVEFICETTKVRGGRRVGIAIINEHTTLKAWYTKLGFNEVELKQFAHLPFTVCFMEKAF